MMGWGNFSSGRLGIRAMRSVVALVTLPVLALSPLSAESILIHYDGHDIHAHTVGFGDLNGWVETEKHQHASQHNHECQMSCPHEHGGEFLIVLDLPDAVLRMRSLGGGVAFVAGLATGPSTTFVSMSDVANDVPLYVRSLFDAATLPDERAVAAILLTNHALLL